MIVATLNKTKIRAVKDMFPGHKVESKTTDRFSDKKPEDMQVFVLAYNRVNHVGAKFSETVVSVEDGVFYDKGKYYISDVCCIRDSGGYRFGYGYFLEISKTMRDYIRSGESLTTLVKTIEEENGRKLKNGVIGYLTDGEFTRKDFALKAIENAVNAKRVDKFNNPSIGSRTMFSNNDSEHFQTLDRRCHDFLQVLKERKLYR